MCRTIRAVVVRSLMVRLSVRVRALISASLVSRWTHSLCPCVTPQDIEKMTLRLSAADLVQLGNHFPRTQRAYTHHTFIVANSEQWLQKQRESIGRASKR